jgi:sarcosine oxidase subunit alpha
MGPSQGKHSHMNALRILRVSAASRSSGSAPPRHGPCSIRCRSSHLAGRGFTPERRTPLDAEHEALGAVWMPAGNWRRPEYYRSRANRASRPSPMRYGAVRTRVGIIDVGTLGKIEVHGPHAAEFLERVYTARFANLKVGMTRYALMLDEAGVHHR